MVNITEILRKYTTGTMSLEETNKALEDAGTTLHLCPKRHDITREELLETHADTAATATGWGLLDTGTGTLDKVRVKEGRLVGVDCGMMHALCIIGGKTFQVKGTVLVGA